MKQFLTFLFTVSVSCYGFGQLGYLGNRVGIELGVTSNYPILKNKREFHNYQVESDLLLPKVSFGIQRENRKGTVVHWQAMYNQLPNSQISSRVSNYDGPTLNSIIDTAWTQSDNLQLSLGWRKFRELAPLGLYFELQFKSNIVFNKSLYRSERLAQFTDNNFFQSTVKYNTLTKVSMVPELGVSMGATYPLNGFMTLDFGAKFNLVLGKFRDKNGNRNQIPDSAVFHRVLSSKKVIASNILELYVNIILFP